MLDRAETPSSGSTDLSSRHQIALQRVHELIANADARAARASKNYYLLQFATIGLAAVTPCLIVLAKESPGNGLLNWLQLFFPAIAAIAAGLTHIFRWREEAVRYTSLAEAIRSELWRFQTRSGDFGGGLSDEQALDRLVVRVDQLNVQSVSRWSSSQLTDGTTTSTSPAPANAE
jgi:hypothetical protein